MRLTLQPADELQNLLDASTRRFAAALSARAKEAARGKSSGHLEDGAIYASLWETQALADLRGRRRTRLYTRNLGRRAYARAPVLPSVPFKEALDDILAREPVLAATAEEVVGVYQAHGFTLAKAVDQQVVEKVQRLIAQSIENGTGRDRTAWVIDSFGDWGRAYSETVYRNAVQNAYNAGIFREMAEPAVRAVIAALEYVSIGDVDTRPNHDAAGHGRLVAAADDPVWHACAPPNGHRCRCGTRYVDHEEAAVRGLVMPDGSIKRATIPSGFFRDPGFSGGRPDVAIYGAA